MLSYAKSPGLKSTVESLLAPSAMPCINRSRLRVASSIKRADMAKSTRMTHLRRTKPFSDREYLK